MYRPTIIPAFLGLLLTLSPAVGCRDLPPAAPPGSTTLPILGGSTTGEFPATGLISGAGGEACTGTLIDPRVVLTAGHCVTDIPSPETFETTGTSEIPGEGATYTITSGTAHPDMDISDLLDPVHDVGVFFIEECASEEAQLLFGDSIRDADLGWVHWVGFGREAPPGDPIGEPLKRAVEMAIDKTGAEWILAEPRDGRSVCEGDSGAPALIPDESGGYVLVGITRGSNAECDLGGLAMRIDTNLDFIAAELEEIGASGDDCTRTVVQPTPGDGNGCASAGNTASGAGQALALIALLFLLPIRRRRS